MQYLAELARDTPPRDKIEEAHFEDSARRRMIVHLLYEGFVNGVGSVGVRGGERWISHAGMTELDAVVREARAKDISRLCAGQSVAVSINHKGRVRLAELEQQIKVGRDRDKFGILFAARHADRDLTIALTHASPDAPLAVAFIDMNGLKSINDTRSHAKGDDAIKAFFQVIMSVVEGVGEGYSMGGDEVLLILPSVPPDKAREMLHAAAKRLNETSVADVGGLSASIGVAFTSDPRVTAETLRERADLEQNTAKEASRVPGRPSTIKLETMDPEILHYTANEARPTTPR